MTANEHRRNVSVCMATYNGDRFLEEQVRSILEELEPGDELIVVDDGSTDQTMPYLRALDHPRVRLYVNLERLGPPQAFARAVSLATNDIILLSDQDDIWLPGRVSTLVTELEATRASLVSSNSEFIDAVGGTIVFPAPQLKREDSTRSWLNIGRIYAGKAGYYGCAMAFSADLRALVLPVPNYVEAHDLWIAMAANVTRSNVHLERPTLQRRIHGRNASVVRRRLHRKLWSRAKFTLALVHLAVRAAALRWAARVGP